MRWLVVALMLLATPAFAAIRLAGADPAPGEEVFIEDNRISLTFGEAVTPLSITVTDGAGNLISTGGTDGTDHDIDVLMKAPQKSGYVCGVTTVAWHVKVIADGREERGVYSFFVKPHWGMPCTHQYKP